jgi:hypothetical protein
LSVARSATCAVPFAVNGEAGVAVKVELASTGAPAMNVTVKSLLMVPPAVGLGMVAVMLFCSARMVVKLAAITPKALVTVPGLKLLLLSVLVAVRETPARLGTTFPFLSFTVSRMAIAVLPSATTLSCEVVSVLCVASGSPATKGSARASVNV